MPPVTRGLHRAAHAVPARPDAGEEGEGLALIDCEPSLGLVGLGVLLFAEGRPRDDAAVVRRRYLPADHSPHPWASALMSFQEFHVASLFS
jgi:hypothetical protein